MNQILRCDWLSGQDGAILPARDFALCPARKLSLKPKQKPYNKSFIDQACSVKIAGYWPRSFFHVYGPLLHLGP